MLENKKSGRIVDLSSRVLNTYYQILNLYNKLLPRPTILRVFLDILVVVAIVLYYASAILAFNHNDFMYATAPALLDRGQLYSDVPYLQTPLTIYLYNFILKITGATHFYFALRVYSLFVIAISAFVLYLVLRKHTNSTLARLFLVFFHSSIFIASLGAEIGNYSTATMFLSLATYCYFNIERRSRAAALTGLFVGLAAAAKLNHAIFALPFLIFIIVDNPRKFIPIFLYALAGILASGLTLYHFLRDPNAFMAWNLQFHVLANIAREMALRESAIVVLDGSHRFMIYSLLPLLIIFAFLIVPKREGLDRDLSKFVWKAGFLAVIGYISAIAPLILFLQYLGPLSVLVSLLACACGYALIKQHPALQTQGLVMTVVIAMVALSTGSSVVFERYARNTFAMGTSNWPIVAVANLRDEISEIGRSTKFDQCSRQVVTFSPIFFLGTPFELTFHSAAGGAVADLYRALGEQARDYAEFGDLNDGLQKIAPTAVLVGYYQNWAIERILLDYALKNDYRARDVGTFKGKRMVLYIRGDCLNEEQIE